VYKKIQRHYKALHKQTLLKPGTTLKNASKTKSQQGKKQPQINNMNSRLGKDLSTATAKKVLLQ
jgi:hypothetical protein